MFSKNIILLLCVVGFIQESILAASEGVKSDSADGASTRGTPVENINPNLDDLTVVDWQNIFNNYDTDRDGSITPKQLQKLLYNDFKVFLTIQQAKSYIYLMNLKKNFEIGWPQLIRLKPVITVLSQRVSIKEFNKICNIPSEEFVNTITSSFNKLFSDEGEVSQLLDLVGLNENSQIKETKYREILQMLGASNEMVNLHEKFLIIQKEDNMVNTEYRNIDGVLDFHEYVSQHKLFEGPSGTSITQKLSNLCNSFIYSVILKDK